MGVVYVLGDQVLLPVSELSLFADHFYSSPTRSCSWLENPELVFFGLLAGNLKPFKISWEQVGDGNKVESLRMRSPHFVDAPP